MGGVGWGLIHLYGALNGGAVVVGRGQQPEFIGGGGGEQGLL